MDDFSFQGRIALCAINSCLEEKSAGSKPLFLSLSDGSCDATRQTLELTLAPLQLQQTNAFRDKVHEINVVFFHSGESPLHSSVGYSSRLHLGVKSEVLEPRLPCGAKLF